MSRVSVIGLGKLGAPMAAVYSSKGHSVVGLDVNPDTVNKINQRMPPVQEPGLKELLIQHPFKATTNYEDLRNTDTTFIIVPTPSDRYGRFSNSYIYEAVTKLGAVIANKKRFHNVVICSTTMPGAVDGMIRGHLEHASGKVVGNQLGLCYSPEFIALGSVVHDMLNPDMVLIGESDRIAGKKLETLIRTVVTAPVRRMNIVNAEIAKISVNTYITMKISFANTLGEICEKITDADAATVANAVGLDSRIGRKYLSPATAYGGPCFPRDTVAFRRMAKDLGVDAELAAATEKVNEWQPVRLAKMLTAILPLGAKVGIVGVAYKADTPVIEASPGLALADKLVQNGLTVKLFDPNVVSGQTKYTHGSSVRDLAGDSDALVLMTPCVDYKALFPSTFQANQRLLVVDCWGLVDPSPWDDTNIIRIGKSR